MAGVRRTGCSPVWLALSHSKLSLVTSPVLAKLCIPLTLTCKETSTTPTHSGLLVVTDRCNQLLDGHRFAERVGLGPERRHSEI